MNKTFLVNSLLRTNGGTRGKGFPTFTTHKDLSTSVNNDVKGLRNFFEIFWKDFTALILPWSSVNLWMITETPPRCKRFPTLTAFIRVFSSVKSTVFNERRLSLKGFPTFSAFIRSFVCVNYLILVRSRTRGKRFPHLLHSYGLNPIWTLG